MRRGPRPILAFVTGVIVQTRRSFRSTSRFPRISDFDASLSSLGSTLYVIRTSSSGKLLSLSGPQARVESGATYSAAAIQELQMHQREASELNALLLGAYFRRTPVKIGFSLDKKRATKCENLSAIPGLPMGVQDQLPAISDVGGAVKTHPEIVWAETVMLDEGVEEGSGGPLSHPQQQPLQFLGGRDETKHQPTAPPTTDYY